MGKKVGMQYVKDFEFPPEQGFTGSAGKQPVKGYMRGGRVKAAKYGGEMTAKEAAKQAAPFNGRKGAQKKARGGTVGVTTERGPKSRRPKDTMTKAAKGGSVHDKLYAAGADMGYARGGQVKDTSAEFVQRSKPMDSMDDGVQPARKGRSQQDVEAGGTPKLRPRYKKGGKVHGVHAVRPKAGGGTRKGAKKGVRKAGKAGMPKNVKAKGGLMEYAEGGSVSPSAGLLGTGGARRAAVRAREREERVRSTVDEALAGQRQSRTASPRPKPQTHDKPPAKRDKIYREDKEGVPTFTDVPKTGRRVARHARGGAVKKSEVRRIAKDVADDTMDRHVRAPRPKGHGTSPRGGRSRARGAEYAEGGVVQAAEGKWIQSAIKKPGALRKSMGVKKGEKIPAKKLAAAAKKSGVTGRRARLAQTLRKMN